MKLSTYLKEVYRILRNTSASIPWDVKAGHLTRLCWRMKDSGYDRSFRRKVIQEGLRGFENAVHEARIYCCSEKISQVLRKTKVETSLLNKT